MTEGEYFEYIRQSLSNTPLKLDVESKGRNPALLLKRAIDLRDEDRLEARRNNDRQNVYRKVWVVTDTDDFTNELLDLIDGASNEGIDLIISNPCFELFVVLHDRAYGGYCEAAQIQAEAKRLELTTGRNNKHVVLDKIQGNFERAEVFSQQLRQRHDRDGKFFPDNNPSTNVDTIIRSLIESATRSIPGFEHTL
ncbi:RloB family protein [Arthrobacter sp. R4-81]